MSFVSAERSEKIPKPPTEIERKFVITSLPDEISLSELQGERIEQGYLANGSGKNTVRIRQKGDKYLWTVKQKYGLNPAERIELECEITEEQFDTMWPATEGKRVQKTRYNIPYDNVVIELDVFEGDNEGYMLAEVEFPSITDADLFVPPVWFGTDVTADGRFGNASIARTGFPEAHQLLDRQAKLVPA